MRIRRFTLLILFALFYGALEAQVLPITHYTPEKEINPLPSAEVHLVYQDKIGYIWLAVYSSGLVRYNGTSMDVYSIDQGLRDLTVWDIIEDASGRLWVSSNAGLVASEKPLTEYDTGESIHFVSEIEGHNLLDRTVNHNRMTVDSSERLWVGTDNIGIVRYWVNDAGLFESDTLSTPLSDNQQPYPVRAVEATGSGTVWVAVTGGKLFRYDDSDRVSEFNSGSNNNISSLYSDDDGTLWGGEQLGRVWQLEERAGRPLFVDIDQSLSGNISNITSDSENNIWVSSEGSGVLKFNSRDMSSLEIIRRENGLLGDIVFNVMEDRENNIWIAQSGGVSKLRYNYRAFNNLTAISYAGERPHLPGPSIGTVLPYSGNAFPCAIFAGSSQGGVACINEQFESELITQEDGLSNNWINGLETDSEGRLWIGTSRGLSSLSMSSLLQLNGVTATHTVTLFGEPGTLSTYNTASILAADKLQIPEDASLSGHAESIWFPGYHEVYVAANNYFYTLNAEDGLPAAIYHTAAFDGDGHLWLGTRDMGIYRSKEPLTLRVLEERRSADDERDLFEPWWSTETGAPSNQIDKLLWLDGLMWIGTPAGLAALEGSSTRKRHDITTADGLRADNATSFAWSPVSETLWVGTNQGLAEVDTENGTVLRTVNRQDGLVDNEVWFYGSVHINSEGVVYYGTANGVTIYDPAKDRVNELPPDVRIENIITEEIQGERNQFTFEYSALSFGNERSIRYQTRLIGFSDEWSVLKPDTRINYTNLPAVFRPKEYAFEVRAVNEGNIWSVAPARYSFQVTPPAWLQWWAFLAYFVLFSIAVFVVDRVQRARLLKKERETAHLRETELKAEAAIARSKIAEVQAKALQAEYDLKESELEKARELESAYHELKTTQNRLIQAEKMASLGRLSTGIAHEIKNPLNFINNFAEVSNELVEELKVAIETNDVDEITFILSNLSFNTEKIEEHGKRADSIVRSMMQHSRGGPAELEKTDLNQLIQKYADLAYEGRKVQNNKLLISVNTDLDPSLEPFDIMAQKIGQVLQNLIENAIDSVWAYSVTQKSGYEPVINIQSTHYDDRVEVRIADNGPGIPEEIRERIFEPFFTTKPTGEGTGLGLSISYDIVTQMHGGKLEIEESDSGGAQFVITLPIRK